MRRLLHWIDEHLKHGQQLNIDDNVGINREILHIFSKKENKKEKDYSEATKKMTE